MKYKKNKIKWILRILRYISDLIYKKKFKKIKI